MSASAGVRSGCNCAIARETALTGLAGPKYALNSSEGAASPDRSSRSERSGDRHGETKMHKQVRHAAHAVFVLAAFAGLWATPAGAQQNPPAPAAPAAPAVVPPVPGSTPEQEKLRL